MSHEQSTVRVTDAFTPLACWFCGSLCKSGWCSWSVPHSNAKKCTHALICHRVLRKTWIQSFLCALRLCFMLEPASSTSLFLSLPFFFGPTEQSCLPSACRSLTFICPEGLRVFRHQFFISLHFLSQQIYLSLINHSSFSLLATHCFPFRWFFVPCCDSFTFLLSFKRSWKAGGCHQDCSVGKNKPLNI